MSQAPLVRVLHVELFERAVTLRLPFRFGAATVTQCPQAFVRIEMEVAGYPTTGASAELMVPKWFDKSPALSHEQNFDQLRLALRLAADAYVDASLQGSAWALSVRAGGAAIEQGTAQGLPRLAAQFGPAQLDKAVADAVLRAMEQGWCAGLRGGLLGDPWGPTLPMPEAQQVTLRHTVGLADRLLDSDPGEPPPDGLPATLQAAIARHGLHHFKLKLAGDAERDVQRLTAITSVLETSVGDYRVTLDGNESFASAESLAHTWRRLLQTPALAPLLQRTLLLEQPLPRALTLTTPIHDLGIHVPVIVDEADDHDQAFNSALAMGYRGISSKACKGIYRSLRNAVEVARLNASAGPVQYLLSGEDLTCQAGLAVQQDSLLAASLGITHIERNGHHYVNGFGSAPEAEGQAFAEAHPGLYERDAAGRVHLAAHHGQLDVRSLHGVGFGHLVEPLWHSLQPLL